MVSAFAQSSPLCHLPLEILEKVILALDDDLANPLSSATLLALLLTCKCFYQFLGCQTNNYLYAELFRLRFDGSAAARRFGELASHDHGFSLQLRSYCSALKCVRTGDIHVNDVVDTFWSCFFMMMEDDGKNRCQLELAGLPELVDKFVRERLYENSENGWPAESEVNSLAMWLLWFTSTEERLRAETPAQRAQMANLILLYVLVPARYVTYFAPHTHFTLPLPRNLAQPPHSFLTVHGPYPQYRDGFSRRMPFYQATDFEVGIPLASVAAKLVYFSRREVMPLGTPPHLPRTREHAIQLGLTMVNPTQEDIQELNEHKVAKLIPKTTWDWWSAIENYDRAPSASWDDDWNPLIDCIHLFTPVLLKRTHYTPGLLSGLWQGRTLHLDAIHYRNIMQTAQMPAAFNEQINGFATSPVFMRLREYHCMDIQPNQPIPCVDQDGSGGIQNGWLPTSMRYQEVSHGLAITCQKRTCFYNEYVVGGPDLHDESNCRRCQYCGMSEIVFREDDAQYLEALDEVLAGEGMNEVEDSHEEVIHEQHDTMVDENSGEADRELSTEVQSKLVIKRKCDGILDIILVGETDLRHGQAWHHYKVYGRVREWDGLVALIRVPASADSELLGVWIFTGYAVGGQNFVGNWRTTDHPGEPVAFESAFAMSKRD
ncbi:hypothetical protein PAXINDRAFT_170794 [Paxillus involutus ATCC 200175]|uniref:F-box domain-containing protein n=1 Tax=Paxillus involutus ATCC 200175 TaxID=664439 RepID=A0A0C9TRH2_PAXIN|nr:hypothetical protein PAXINDRAFT_170794 [Paxillus involutus ATCC 200175]